MRAISCTTCGLPCFTYTRGPGCPSAGLGWPQPPRTVTADDDCDPGSAVNPTTWMIMLNTVWADTERLRLAEDIALRVDSTNRPAWFAGAGLPVDHITWNRRIASATLFTPGDRSVTLAVTGTTIIRAPMGAIRPPFVSRSLAISYKPPPMGSTKASFLAGVSSTLLAVLSMTGFAPLAMRKPVHRAPLHFPGVSANDTYDAATRLLLLLLPAVMAGGLLGLMRRVDSSSRKAGGEALLSLWCWGHLISAAAAALAVSSKQMLMPLLQLLLWLGHLASSAAAAAAAPSDQALMLPHQPLL
ncbi:hypothetical protein COO60DRAFT_1201359 [Scenedesmus sp. NREL 46B-D3]|nr:hypothetical protein COO60DRAFT_1201359 [Scenedesmus sp. NREL 46B-D3]